MNTSNDDRFKSSSTPARQQGEPMPPKETKADNDSLYTQQPLGSTGEKMPEDFPEDKTKGTQRISPTYTNNNSRNNTIY